MPPPKHLDRIGKAMWNDLAPLLAKQGSLTEADTLSLSILCAEWSIYTRTSKDLEEHGYTQKSESGWEQIRPQVAIRNNALDRVIKIAAHFGLNPISRKKLNGGSSEAEKDELLDWS